MTGPISPSWTSGLGTVKRVSLKQPGSRTLVDESGDPDEKSQQKLFKQMLESPAKRGRKAGALVSQKQTVWTRSERLKRGKQNRFVDPVYKPVIEAVVRYLSGETKGIHV